MKKAQIADKKVDASADVTGYKQAVDNLSASISACVGADLLSEDADVVVDARELEKTMQKKLTETIEKARQALLGCISRAETTREPAALSAKLDSLVADEVLRESCGDAIESAEDLVSTLQAEEKEQITAVSVYLCVST